MQLYSPATNMKIADLESKRSLFGAAFWCIIHTNYCILQIQNNPARKAMAIDVPLIHTIMHLYMHLTYHKNLSIYGTDIAWSFYFRQKTYIFVFSNFSVLYKVTPSEKRKTPKLVVETGFATAFDLTQVMSDRVFVRGFDYGTGEDAIKAHFLQAETKWGKVDGIVDKWFAGLRWERR